jgi:hypothetical protein
VLIDYLRYVAYRGRLRPFFEKGIADVIARELTTGYHVRFSDQQIEKWSSHSEWWRLISTTASHFPPGYLRREFGIFRIGRSNAAGAAAGSKIPLTCDYGQDSPVEVEVVIDVDPDRWEDRFSEPRFVEGIPIRMRPSPPALGRLASGDKVFDVAKGTERHGTLCGLVRSGQLGEVYALTCGHVARAQSVVHVTEPRRMWRIPLGQTRRVVGRTRFYCEPPKYAGHSLVPCSIDAALIPLANARPASLTRHGAVKAITAMRQEDSVCFMSSTRRAYIRTKIDAVTVRKAIDLHQNGELYDMGDVLMLSNHEYRYVPSSPVRDGDSGAAVQLCHDEADSPWYGMIVGSGPTSAYATYSEFLMGWAAEATGGNDLGFYYRS